MLRNRAHVFLVCGLEFSWTVDYIQTILPNSFWKVLFPTSLSNLFITQLYFWHLNCPNQWVPQFNYALSEKLFPFLKKNNSVLIYFFPSLLLWETESLFFINLIYAIYHFIDFNDITLTSSHLFPKFCLA